MSFKIVQIADVLYDYDNYNFVEEKISRLTAAGENFGSLMLAIQITLKNKKTSGEKILNTVAKLIPPNDFIQKLFNIQASFKNEVAFYEIIVPTLRNFRRQSGVEDMRVFAHSYGSRINLNGGEVVDENGILMLENLRMTGYKMLDRMKGVDLETAKCVVAELAGFHATSLALKRTNPEIFNKKVRPHMKGFVLRQKEVEKTLGAWETTLRENPVTAKLCPKIMKVLLKGSKGKPREPLATLCHTDLWMNNVMFKINDGVTESIKFLDFQFIDYRSPACDLIFFLFSSVSAEVLENDFSYLFEYYFDNFMEILSKLNCDMVSLTFESFMEEVKTEAVEEEIYHIAFMTMVIYAAKETAKEITEFDEKEGFYGNLSNFQKEKIWFLASQFEKMNWI